MKKWFLILMSFSMVFAQSAPVAAQVTVDNRNTCSTNLITR